MCVSRLGAGSGLAQPCTIWLSRINTSLGFACDALRVRARILSFTERMGRSAMNV